MKSNQIHHQKNNNQPSGAPGRETPAVPATHRDVWTVSLRCAFRGKGGFGLNEVIGIAAGIIIAVVVVIPGLQGFAGNILDNLTDWWNNMASSVFSMG